jgi:hypothetical protein
MSFFEKAQQLADATPAPVNWTVMLGSLAMSILQPLAATVAIVWGVLQIYLAVEKRWGFDWAKRLFGKGK